MKTEELDLTTLALGALIVPFVLAIGIGTGLLDSFVLWKIWTWHAVPLGAIPLSYGAVVGADLFLSVALAGWRPERPTDDWWKRYAAHLLLLGLALVLARLFAP